MRKITYNLDLNQIIEADTLETIKQKYGSDTVPLQKSVPPFMPFKDGYGYRGILLYGATEDKVMCHFCGEWRSAINNAHLRMHGLTSLEYKLRVGLYPSTSLMGLELKTVRSQAGKKAWQVFQKAIKIKEGQKKRKSPTTKFNSKRLDEWKNSLGLCEAQLEQRLHQLTLKLKRPITQNDNSALTSALRRRFGSWGKAMEFYGYSDMKFGKMRRVK